MINMPRTRCHDGVSRLPPVVCAASVLFRGALLLIACLAAGAQGREVAPAAARPNVIIILADDLGYGSVGCYGADPGLVRTPNIDRLAAGGVRLTDFHSNGAMCSPTRAALMTGRYPQRCAWVPDDELSAVSRAQRADNVKQRWAWGISRDEVTLPGLLRRAGYRTSLIGKWHLGYDVAFHPLNHGFDEFRGFVGGAVDYHTHVATHGSQTLDWWQGRELRDEPGYATDLLSRYAVDFIARNKQAPFFLLLAPGAPHVPWQGRAPAGRRSPTQTYAEMIGTLDDAVGAVVGALRTHGLEEKTLVVFCSDNGPAAPRGFPANGALKGAKGDMTEGGHRVPFVAYFPGVIAGGKTSGEVVMTMDLLPTVARLAGATLPEGHRLDGVDVMPTLKGEARPPERTLHWLFGNDWAVRSGPWKLTGSGGKARTLVNLADDLAEKHDLLGADPARAGKLNEMHRRWVAETGDR